MTNRTVIIETTDDKNNSYYIGHGSIDCCLVDSKNFAKTFNCVNDAKAYLDSLMKCDWPIWYQELGIKRKFRFIQSTFTIEIKYIYEVHYG